MTDEKTPSERWLYHIALRDEWLEAGEHYVPGGYANEGFIHLSKASQVEATAGRYYANRTDIVVLRIDANALTDEVVEENLLGGTELFPHLYGPCPRSAVVATGRIRWSDCGTATLEFEQAENGLGADPS